MRLFTSRSVVAATALALTVVAGPVCSSTAAPARPAAPSPAASVAGPSETGPQARSGATTSRIGTTARFAGSIRTGRRAAVNRAYWRRYAGNIDVPIGWTGNNNRCRAGTTSHRSRSATLETINFVRAMGGLEPIAFRRRLNAQAQKAALIMSANNGLSHFPPRSWRCWTRSGSDAAGRSNLAIAFPQITSGQLVELYMTDSGENNTVVGHRRWVMNPFATVMGNGTTSTANALVVFGPEDPANANPRWVSWPTAGWFPSPMEPAHRWSLSSGDRSTDFSDARVRVTTASGERVRVHTWPVTDGYAQPTLVWEVRRVRPTGRYRVTVSNIKHAGSAKVSRHTYRVKLFRPRR